MARGEGDKREPEEDPSDRAERVDDGAHLLDLLGRRDLQLGDIGRQPVDSRGRQARVGGHPLQQAAEVEVDRHVRPVDRPQQRLVRSPVRVLPGRKGGGGAEQARGVPAGDLLEARRRWPRERLQRGRQRRLEARLDLVTVVQALDEVEPDGCADRLVLDQLGAQVDPVVGVQRPNGRARPRNRPAPGAARAKRGRRRPLARPRPPALTHMVGTWGS
jgi:hypothetical protein